MKERPLQAILAVAASVAGLAAYLYVLGGLVQWLRLTAARLPADNATSAFDSRDLLTVGLRVILFEAVVVLVLLLLLSALSAVALAADKGIRKKKKRKKKKKNAELHTGVWLAKRFWIARVVIQAVLVGVAVAALIHWQCQAELWFWGGGFIAFLTSGTVGMWKPDSFQEPPALKFRVISSSLLALVGIFFMGAPLGVAYLILIALLQTSWKLESVIYRGTRTERLVTSLVSAAAMSLVIVTYLATPPVTFNRAVLILKGSKHRRVYGGYIGKSASDVYLATCRPDTADPHSSNASRIRAIPAARTNRLILGGTRYTFDYGPEPSLFNLAVYLVKHDETEQEPRALPLDRRDDEPVCGKNPDS